MQVVNVQNGFIVTDGELVWDGDCWTGAKDAAKRFSSHRAAVHAMKVAARKPLSDMERRLEKARAFKAMVQRLAMDRLRSMSNRNVISTSFEELCQAMNQLKAIQPKWSALQADAGDDVVTGFCDSVESMTGVAIVDAAEDFAKEVDFGFDAVSSNHDVKSAMSLLVTTIGIRPRWLMERVARKLQELNQLSGLELYFSSHEVLKFRSGYDFAVERIRVDEHEANRRMKHLGSMVFPNDSQFNAS